MQNRALRQGIPRGVNLPPPGDPSRVDTIHHPGLGGDWPMPHVHQDPLQGSWQNPCGEERVALAGGMLNALMVDPMIVAFEQLYRRLPEAGMFSPSIDPEHPMVFEMGAFKPPSTMCLILFDLRPAVYRQCGAAAGDTVPVESRRLSTVLGWEVLIDKSHLGQTMYQLDPPAIQLGGQEAYTVPVLSPTPRGEVVAPPPSLARFNISAASSYAAASGAGLQLMPNRAQGRWGPTNAPFMQIVRSSQTIQIRCAVFRPIPIALAFFEYDIAGYVLPETWVDAMLGCVRPVHPAAGGPGSRGIGGR